MPGPDPSPPQSDPHIGTLNEGSLHAALKSHYARPGDELEAPLHGFVADIRRGDLLIEIQTGSFAAMGRKLDHLLGEHRVLLVHPIAVETQLEKPDGSTRRSPKRGSVLDVFDELVSIPTLLDHPHLSLEVVLAAVTEVRVPDPTVRRRRGFRTADRRLREILGTRRFDHPTDLLDLLPDGLPARFTSADLAAAVGAPRPLAQRMAYCFRALGLFTEHGRTRAGVQYSLGAAIPRRPTPSSTTLSS